MCVFIDSFGGKGAWNWLLVRSFVHRKMFRKKAMEWKQKKAPLFVHCKCFVEENKKVCQYQNRLGNHQSMMENVLNK